MKKICFAVALFVVAGLLLSFSSQADAQKKKKKGKFVTGQLSKINKEKDEVKSIVVKVFGKKKKGEPAPEPKEVTFNVNKDTKVEKAGEKKGDPATDAKLSDLAVGQRVQVAAAADSADTAALIRILPMKKKKKADN